MQCEPLHVDISHLAAYEYPPNILIPVEVPSHFLTYFFDTLMS